MPVLRTCQFTTLTTHQYSLWNACNCTYHLDLHINMPFWISYLLCQCFQIQSFCNQYPAEIMFIFIYLILQVFFFSISEIESFSNVTTITWSCSPPEHLCAAPYHFFQI